MDYSNSQESIDSDNYDFGGRESDELMIEDLTITDDFDNVGRGSCSRNSVITSKGGNSSRDNMKRVGNDFDHQTAAGVTSDKRAMRPKSARYGCRPGSMLAVHETSVDGVGGTIPKTPNAAIKRSTQNCNPETISPTSSASSSLTSCSSPTSCLSSGLGDVKNMATEYVDDVVLSSVHVTARPQSSRKPAADTGNGLHNKKVASSRC